jgi:hypothetical protein
MPNNEQIIIEDSVTISGDITVEGSSEALALDTQISLDIKNLLTTLIEQQMITNELLKELNT